MKNRVVLRWLGIGLASFLLTEKANAQTPANDNFTNRTVLTLGSPVVSGSNVNATKETGEPNHAGNAGGKSVWWTWTAPATGTVKISTTGSSFDTVLGIYTGSSVSGLTNILSDDDHGGGGTSLASLNAVAGTEYQIAVDGFDGANGSIVLKLDALPSNISPTSVSGTAGLPFTTNILATNSPIFFQASALPPGISINSASGAISGTPTTGGVYSGSLLVSNAFGSTSTNFTFTVDTAPVITSSSTASGAVNNSFSYTITALNNPTGFGATTLPSGLTLNAGTGVISGSPTVNGVFNVTLSATNSSGFRTKQLTITIGALNDDFANATIWDGASPATASSASATKESGEPNHADNAGGKSLWWSWTPSVDGVVQIDTISSDFDTLLGVLSSTVGSEAWNSRDLKSRPH